MRKKIKIKSKLRFNEQSPKVMMESKMRKIKQKRQCKLLNILMNNLQVLTHLGLMTILSLEVRVNRLFTSQGFLKIIFLWIGLSHKISTSQFLVVVGATAETMRSQAEISSFESVSTRFINMRLQILLNKTNLEKEDKQVEGKKQKKRVRMR